MRCGRSAHSRIRGVYMFTLKRVDIDASADTLGPSHGGCACRRCGKSEERKKGERKAKAGTISGEGGFPGRASPQAEARSEERGGGSRSLSRHLLPQQVTQARVRGLSRKGTAVAMEATCR